MKPAKPKPSPLKRLKDALREAQATNDKLTRDLAALAVEGRLQRREIRQLKLYWNAYTAMRGPGEDLIT